MTALRRLRLWTRDGIAACLLGMAALAGGAAANPAAEPSPACAASAAAPAAEHLARAWTAALESNDAAAIAALYAEDAVVIPSDTPGPLSGWQAIRDFYVALVARHPRAARMDRVVQTGCEIVIDAGTVTFRVTGKRKGTRMLIGGRFSATYAMRDGAWRIVSHSLETLPLAYAQALPAHTDTSRPN